MATSPQGQSKATRPKQESLASFIAAHASIVSLIQAKAKWVGPYCYIDTNAGSGWNDQVNCPGSPVVAKTQLHFCEGLSFRIFCIEKNEDSAFRLRQQLGSGHCVICEDHATALPQLDLPRSPYGLVYADPNALLDAPVEAMRAFFQRPDTKRIDVLININAVTVRRVVAGQQSGNPGSYDDLPGIMKRAGKSYWWIRDPYITAGSKWTFLFGSNSHRINIKKLGHGGLSLYPVDSSRGKSLLDSLTGSALPGKRSSSHFPYRTYKDYLAHPMFFALRQTVFRRAAGRCELCKVKPASEVHHRVYPAWGTFDHPDSLVAICHHCHCKAHGVTT